MSDWQKMAVGNGVSSQQFSSWENDWENNCGDWTSWTSCMENESDSDTTLVSSQNRQKLRTRKSKSGKLLRQEPGQTLITDFSNNFSSNMKQKRKRSGEKRTPNNSSSNSSNSHSSSPRENEFSTDRNSGSVSKRKRRKTGNSDNASNSVPSNVSEKLFESESEGATTTGNVSETEVENVENTAENVSEFPPESRLKRNELDLGNLRSMSESEKLDALLLMVLNLDKKLDNKIKEETEKLNIRISGIRQELDVLKQTAEVNRLKHKIVVRNMAETRNENVTNKVMSLFRDGLKLNIIPEEVERKKAYHSNQCGVIIVTLQSESDKINILKSKRKLKSSKQFSKVYVEEEKSRDQREYEANMKVIAGVLGSRVKLQGSRIVPATSVNNSSNSRTSKEKQIREKHGQNSYAGKHNMHNKSVTDVNRHSQRISHQKSQNNSQRGVRPPRHVKPHEDRQTTSHMPSSRQQVPQSKGEGSRRYRDQSPNYHFSQVAHTSREKSVYLSDYTSEEELCRLESPPDIPYSGKGKNLPWKKGKKNRRNGN